MADSKKLSANQRKIIAGQIKERAICWAIGRAEASEIDHINILQATFIAMQRAFSLLEVPADYVMIDGNCLPKLNCPGEAVIKGDQLIPEISAASILAKVARDEEMLILDRLYPGYGLAQHKGYPTQQHLSSLQQIGISSQHRKSFAPVKKFLL